MCALVIVFVVVADSAFLQFTSYPALEALDLDSGDGICKYWANNLSILIPCDCLVSDSFVMSSSTT